LPLMRKNILYPLIIALAVVAVYARTVTFDYTGFDDEILVYQNRGKISSTKDIKEIFKSDAFLGAYGKTAGSYMYYRPLLNVSLMADTLLNRAGPEEPAYLIQFRITNILLHALAAVLLFFLLIKLKTGYGLSLALCLFFAFNTALSAAVVWLPGRNDSLLAVFILAAVLSYIYFAETGKKIYLFLYAFFFMPAVFIKENALLLPAAAFLYSTLVEKRLSKSGFLKLAAASFIPVLVFITAYSALAPKSDFSLFSLQNIKAAAINLRYLADSAGRALVPLSPYIKKDIYSIPVSFFYPAAAAAFFLSVLFYCKEEKRGTVWFGLLWYLIFLIPAVMFQQVIIEDRLYLPYAGLLIAAGAAAGPSSGEKRKLLGSLSALFFLFIFFNTLIFDSYFRDRYIFSEKLICDSPGWDKLYTDYGVKNYRRGLYREAERLFLKAKSLAPDDTDVNFSLGKVYEAEGRIKEAGKAYAEELLSHPENKKAETALNALKKSSRETER